MDRDGVITVTAEEWRKLTLEACGGVLPPGFSYVVPPVGCMGIIGAADDQASRNFFVLPEPITNRCTLTNG